MGIPFPVEMGREGDIEKPMDTLEMRTGKPAEIPSAADLPVSGRFGSATPSLQKSYETYTIRSNPNGGHEIITAQLVAGTCNEYDRFSEQCNCGRFFARFV
jgi:hypothetical protein